MGEGRGEGRTFNWLALAALCFILHPSSLILAGTLRTLDGRTLEGELKLEQNGVISITPRTGKPEKIDLADILQATFRDPPVESVRPAQQASAVIQTENGKLPAPWQATDIGNLRTDGYARYTAGDFSLKCAGAALGEKADALCFVNQPTGPTAGDTEISARILSIGEARTVSAGLMLRASADPGAPYAALVLTAGNLHFLNRTRAGEAAEGGPVGDRRLAALPVHLRLTRHNGTVTAYASRDGESWQQLASQTLPVSRESFAGLAVCSRSERLLGAHFDKVRLISVAPVTKDAATTGTTAATAEPPRPLKPGILLTSGTLLAGGAIERADDGTLRYLQEGRRDAVSLASVARVIFRELTPEQAARIPEKRTGVLLREGDFVEGEFKGISRDGRLQLSSVLFGLAKFEPREKAAALILNEPDPASRAQTMLRTMDGSTYVAKSIAYDKDKLLIDDPAAGHFEVNRWAVIEIAAGPGRLQPLSALKPSTVDVTTKGAGDGLCIDSTGIGLPMTVSGITAAHGLTLTAGSAASWDLAGQYRTLTFKCGVPTGILPTAPVRFIVLADGKELFRSKPCTSADPLLTATVSVKGAKSLTLKTESTTPEPLPTPGLWADPSLVK